MNTGLKFAGSLPSSKCLIISKQIHHLTERLFVKCWLEIDLRGGQKFQLWRLPRRLGGHLVSQGPNMWTSFFVQSDWPKILMSSHHLSHHLLNGPLLYSVCISFWGFWGLNKAFVLSFCFFIVGHACLIFLWVPEFRPCWVFDRGSPWFAWLSLNMDGGTQRSCQVRVLFTFLLTSTRS